MSEIETHEPPKELPDPVPAPPSVEEPKHDEPHTESADELKEMLRQVLARLDKLESGITESGPESRDSTPSKPPWTHRGF